MSIEKIYNVTIIEAAIHPVDGMPGTAVVFNATGIECLYSGGALRSLPHNWRQAQPKMECGTLLSWASTMTANVS
jgi:hypothetical protein